MSDSQGLRAAYESPLGYHIGSDNTLYLRGTTWDRGPGVLARDVLDDMKLPWSGVAGIGGARNTAKYADAVHVLRVHPDIHTIVGHSLGAAVAKQLAKDTGRGYRAYAAPAVTWKDDPNSFRRYGDPISVFDRGAQDTLPSGWNPHSYA